MDLAIFFFTSFTKTINQADINCANLKKIKLMILIRYIKRCQYSLLMSGQSCALGWMCSRALDNESVKVQIF